MDKYFKIGRITPHLSSENLFSLRSDLRLTFDNAQFVVVPKLGQFVVHFLQESVQNVGRYQNTVFDTRGILSPQALYARFAWALMTINKRANIDPVLFGPKADDTDNDVKEEEQKPELGPRAKGKSAAGKGKRKYQQGTRSSARIKEQRRKLNPDDPDHDSIEMARTLNLQADPFLHDVLTKIAPGDDASLAADLQEIEDDLKEAAQDLPFFGMKCIACLKIYF